MKKSLITLCLVALVLVTPALVAQDAPAQDGPAAYITVHIDNIDPAHMMAYEANSKQWVDAFGAAGAGPDYYWRGYQSGYSYAWVSDLANYAWLDGTEDREKMIGEKLGEGKMDELMAGGGDAILDHYTEIWKYQPELSYMPEGFSPDGMKAVNVSTVSVKPSMGKQYREVVKEAVAALQKIKADKNWVAYSTPFGAGTYAYVSWAPDRSALHSGADMGDLMNEALGDEASMDLYKRYLDCVAGEEERDWRARPDVSYTGGGDN